MKGQPTCTRLVERVGLIRIKYLRALQLRVIRSLFSKRKVGFCFQEKVPNFVTSETIGQQGRDAIVRDTFFSKKFTEWTTTSRINLEVKIHLF